MHVPNGKEMPVWDCGPRAYKTPPNAAHPDANDMTLTTKIAWDDTVVAVPAR